MSYVLVHNEHKMSINCGELHWIWPKAIVESVPDLERSDSG